MESNKEQLLMYGVDNIQHIRENSFWKKDQTKKLNILDHYTRQDFIREVYLWIAKEHQNYFYTNKYWDAFAKQHNYPDSNKYRKVFSKWKIAKQLVHGELSEFEMRQKFLLEIATKYKNEFFEKHQEWDDFARRIDLPKTDTYKNHFSYSYLHFIERILAGEMTDYHDLNVLQELSKQILQKSIGNTKEELTTILIENREYVATQKLWVSHAREHNLPQLNVIVRHFGSFNGMKRELGLMDVFSGKVYSQEELIQMGIEYHTFLKPHLWNIFHELHNLPGVDVIKRRFGDFWEFKRIIDQQIGKTEKKPLNQEIGETLFNQKMDMLMGLYEEHQELIQKAKTYWHATKLKNKWNNVSKQHQLPDYDRIIAKFHSLKNFRSTIFISFALDTPSLFTSKSWDNYAKQKGLPLRSEYRNNFYNKINLFENYLNINQKEKNQKEEFVLLLKEHYEAFSTLSNDKWRKYSSKHGLPSSDIIARVFGSWNDAKQALGVKKLRHNINSREELIELTKPHLAHFTTSKEWIAYTKEHNLPSIATYKKFFGSFNEAKEALGLGGKKKQVRNKISSSEELIELTKPHLAHFTTSKEWISYAQEHGLPSLSTYRKFFGSFNKAKEALEDNTCLCL